MGPAEERRIRAIGGLIGDPVGETGPLKPDATGRLLALVDRRIDADVQFSLRRVRRGQWEAGTFCPSETKPWRSYATGYGDTPADAVNDLLEVIGTTSARAGSRAARAA